MVLKSLFAKAKPECIKVLKINKRLVEYINGFLGEWADSNICGV